MSITRFDAPYIAVLPVATPHVPTSGLIMQGSTGRIHSRFVQSRPRRAFHHRVKLNQPTISSSQELSEANTPRYRTAPFALPSSWPRNAAPSSRLRSGVAAQLAASRIHVVQPRYASVRQRPFAQRIPLVTKAVHR